MHFLEFPSSIFIRYPICFMFLMWYPNSFHFLCNTQFFKIVCASWHFHLAFFKCETPISFKILRIFVKPQYFYQFMDFLAFPSRFFCHSPKFSDFTYFLVFSSGFFNVTPSPPFFFFFLNLMRFLAFPSSLFFFLMWYPNLKDCMQFLVFLYSVFHVILQFFTILCTYWCFYPAFLCNTPKFL